MSDGSGFYRLIQERSERWLSCNSYNRCAERVYHCRLMIQCLKHREQLLLHHIDSSLLLVAIVVSGHEHPIHADGRGSSLSLGRRNLRRESCTMHFLCHVVSLVV